MSLNSSVKVCLSEDVMRDGRSGLDLTGLLSETLHIRVIEVFAVVCVSFQDVCSIPLY